VEIGRWHRGGYLRAGSYFSWSWNRGGEPTGSIGVRVHGEHSLALQFNITGNDGQQRDASQTIRLAHTPCHYGRSRPWFVCPVCHNRAGVLYLRASRFACRTCQRVAYSSQSCDALDRMWRKQSKLEARLDENWTRPKGMRNRTYEAVLDALDDCEERRNATFVETVARLFGATGLAELENLAV